MGDVVVAVMVEAIVGVIDEVNVEVLIVVMILHLLLVVCTNVHHLAYCSASPVEAVVASDEESVEKEMRVIVTTLILPC